MRRFLTIGILLLTSTPVLRAQYTYQEKEQLMADAIRERVSCPLEVDWPILPLSGREVFKTEVRDSTGTVVYALPDSMRRERPDITIPQYAYFYSPSADICEPVILVQAEGTALGYQAIQRESWGVSSEIFFDLLGIEPPQGPEVREEGR